MKTCFEVLEVLSGTGEVHYQVLRLILRPGFNLEPWRLILGSWRLILQLCIQPGATEARSAAMEAHFSFEEAHSVVV